MQRLIFIIITLFFLFSCGKGKPEGVVSESKMTDILTEVSLIDGYLNSLAIDSGRKVMPVLYQNMFKKFDLDSASFMKNLNYYYGNPQLTGKIYVDVSKKLTLIEKDINTVDSLRNVRTGDSLRTVAKWDRIRNERNNMTLYVFRDTLPYKYQDNATKFYDQTGLNMQVYGVQIPVQSVPVPSVLPQVAPTEVPTEEVLQMDTPVDVTPQEGGPVSRKQNLRRTPLRSLPPAIN